MKNSSKILLVAIIMISMLATLHFAYGLFTPYNYITAKWDIAHEKPRILQYGESMLTEEQSKKIAPDFGFKYEIVAGCIGTSLLVS